METKRIS